MTTLATLQMDSDSMPGAQKGRARVGLFPLRKPWGRMDMCMGVWGSLPKVGPDVQWQASRRQPGARVVCLPPRPVYFARSFEMPMAASSSTATGGASTDALTRTLQGAQAALSAPICCRQFHHILNYLRDGTLPIGRARGCNRRHRPRPGDPNPASGGEGESNRLQKSASSAFPSPWQLSRYSRTLRDPLAPPPSSSMFQTL